jgi:hypothetical protein
MVHDYEKQKLNAAKSKIYERETASRPRIYVLETFGDNPRDIITLGGTVRICTIRETVLAVMQICIKMDENERKETTFLSSFFQCLFRLVVNSKPTKFHIHTNEYVNCPVVASSSPCGIDVFPTLSKTPELSAVQGLVIVTVTTSFSMEDFFKHILLKEIFFYFRSRNVDDIQVGFRVRNVFQRMVPTKGSISFSKACQGRVDPQQVRKEISWLKSTKAM